jgi:hypothetical protein
LSEEVMTNESIFPQSRSSEPQNFVKKIKKFKTNIQEEPANNKKVKKLIKKKKIVSSAVPRAPTTAPTFSPSDSFQTEQPFNRSNKDSRCKLLPLKNDGITIKAVYLLIGFFKLTFTTYSHAVNNNLKPQFGFPSSPNSMATTDAIGVVQSNIAKPCFTISIYLWEKIALVSYCWADVQIFA